MEPLVSRAAEAGAADRGEQRPPQHRGSALARRHRHRRGDRRRDPRRSWTRALNRAVAWLRENEERSREELLRDLKPEQRKTGMMPELLGVQGYQASEFNEKVDWMMDRGFLKEAPAYKDVVRSK